MKWEKFVLENEENSEYPMKNRERWAKTIVNIKHQFNKKIDHQDHLIRADI